MDYSALWLYRGLLLIRLPVNNQNGMVNRIVPDVILQAAITGSTWFANWYLLDTQTERVEQWVKAFHGICTKSILTT